MSFDLIIWDCDGCLVDSEVVACTLEAKLFTKMGYPLSVEEDIDRFAGCNPVTALQEIERETGRSFLDRFSPDQFQVDVVRALENTLEPIANVAGAIEQLDGKRCIASGSSPRRVQASLLRTNLARFFDPETIFSTSPEKDDLAAPKIVGKPAPDIFLYAAEKMGVAPARCLVIEDSVHGVRAAQAANMTVFAFTGASHVTPKWAERLKQENPDALFSDMRDLAGMVKG